ncbi:hypothetical protein HETIRDRAFT_412107 [Heterobasidion irregulare TC 32-1]|uniref:DUF6534 domain-containing protein n=1 Tax=Heterobasidion irregulare (strain TC 32-1) TaxID=747525 RepID=W4JS22_HETIT|nr:uncharacterized protein HETIRDRAFT_412107 [Heterobasidion irregulare TC 32-1]ETW75681.1 hypothetical protein HETIRDRAFT_412107 [Heterobasidion irregulare TC 32-1]
MASSPNALPNFAQTVQGPTLIGLFLNLILYGTFISQAHFYFSTFKRDQRWFKIFIASLVFFETINSVFAMYYSYDRLVNNFGDMPAQAVSNWAFGIGPLTNGIIAMSVQTFFAWRVKVLTGQGWMMVAITFLSVVSSLAAMAIFFVAAILIPSPTVSAAQIFRPVVITWLVGSALADTLISAVLVFHLRQNRSAFSTTNDAINRIIRLTVQTGVITSVWAIIDLGVYLGDSTAHHVIFNLSLAKLYSNSLLSSLNSREGWKYTSALDASGRSEDATRGPQRIRPPNVVFSSQSVRPEVYIDIESHELRDTSADAKRAADTTTSGYYRNSDNAKQSVTL